jgi:hypothetical protein
VSTLEKFEHECQECGEVIYSYSAQGRDTMLRLHQIQHNMDRIRKTAEFDEKRRVQPVNHNIFKLSRIDAGFLKTRGILVDDNTEIDWNQEPVYDS